MLIAVGIVVIVYSSQLQIGTLLRPQPGFFPFLVGLGIITLSSILIIQALLGRSEIPKLYGNWQRPSIMVASLAVYSVILTPLGYILSTIFIAAVTLRVMGIRSWRVIGVVSLTLSVTVYFLFTKALEVELPPGILSFLD